MNNEIKFYEFKNKAFDICDACLFAFTVNNQEYITNFIAVRQIS